MSNSTNKVTKALFLLVTALVIAVLANNFYIFYIQKNYDLTVEAPCDPTAKTCFIRSCGEDSECPPNGLEQYRMFTLNASDFNQCTDNSCLNECLAGLIECAEIQCGDLEDDVCSSPSSAE